MTHAAQRSKPKRTKPAGSPSTASPTPSPIPTSSTSTQSDWIVQQAATPSRFAAKAEADEAMSEDDLIEREAIRNLYPLLSSPSRTAHRDYVYPPKDARLSRKSAEMRRLMDERPEIYR